jgi:ABC-2 type transport system permease protein
VSAAAARPAPGSARERVFELVRKEFRQVLRDPRLWRVIFVAPIIQLLAFGYAVSTDVHEVSTFVVDHDRSAASRELIEKLTASRYFVVTGASQRSADLVDALLHGRAVLGVEVPAGFSRDLRTRADAHVQLLLDGTNSNQALVARGYAERILQSYGLRLAREGLVGGDGFAGSVASAAVVDLRERAWFNPDLKSRNYNVPGVVGQLIMLVSLLLTSLAVVRERELGTLEQLMVSPLRPLELIAGKTIPFALVGLIDLVLVTAVAVFWFHIPFRGSLALLVLASVLYLLSGLGLGLLISTIAATQQEAFLTTFLIFMPAILLSGFMFPVSSMPELFQWLTLLNPVRHYLFIVRALFLKGVGWAAIWPSYVALLLIGGAVLAFAAARFHKTVE